MPLSHLHESEPLHSISGNVKSWVLCLTAAPHCGVNRAGLCCSGCWFCCSDVLHPLPLLLAQELVSPAGERLGAAMYRPHFVLLCFLWNSSSQGWLKVWGQADTPTCFNRERGGFQGMEVGEWKGFSQQCHCTAALTGSQLQGMVSVLHLQVKMCSFVVTDHCPSLWTLLREGWTHWHLFLVNRWASEHFRIKPSGFSSGVSELSGCWGTTLDRSLFLLPRCLSAQRAGPNSSLHL